MVCEEPGMSNNKVGWLQFRVCYPMPRFAIQKSLAAVHKGEPTNPIPEIGPGLVVSIRCCPPVDQIPDSASIFVGHFPDQFDEIAKRVMVVFGPCQNKIECFTHVLVDFHCRYASTAHARGIATPARPIGGARHLRHSGVQLRDTYPPTDIREPHHERLEALHTLFQRSCGLRQPRSVDLLETGDRLEVSPSLIGVSDSRASIELTRPRCFQAKHSRAHKRPDIKYLPNTPPSAGFSRPSTAGSDCRRSASISFRNCSGAASA